MQLCFCSIIPVRFGKAVGPVIQRVLEELFYLVGVYVQGSLDFANVGMLFDGHFKGVIQPVAHVEVSGEERELDDFGLAEGFFNGLEDIVA